jgi:hypothetical protein
MAAYALIASAAILAAVAIGVGVAWWLHRRTALSARNLYLAWATSAPLSAGLAFTASSPVVSLAGGAIFSGATAGAVAARRWRIAALGAGGELRQFERRRVMVWNASRTRDDQQRVYIGSQGELVRKRAWPAGIPSLPMTADGRGRVPLREGMHLFFVGATGGGKTTSARRWLLARGLGEERTALLVLDPKGDADLEADLRGIASERNRPFVLFDPFVENTDRWNPIWADDPGAVVARVVAPVEADSDSDASHYSRVLRVHLGLVAEVLKAAGRWPVSMPVLLRCAQRPRYAAVKKLADALAMDKSLIERLDDHREALDERTTKGQLDGSLRALEVVAGQAWRRVLTPRADGAAVTLPDAMASGAVVLWKTHVEDAKEEAETITTLALADIAAAALTLPRGAEWALLVDEFGSVLQGRAGERAVALMQRARSSHGQMAVSTQSVADIASATGNEQLLASLTDNFTGFVLHRQTSPESRDWLAMLLGTRELWQSTDRTRAGGAFAEGTGSRRRAAEFVFRPDEFKLLRAGEAVVWTTLGPAAEQIWVTPGPAVAAGPVCGESLYTRVAITSVEDAMASKTLAATESPETEPPPPSQPPPKHPVRPVRVVKPKSIEGQGMFDFGC